MEGCIARRGGPQWEQERFGGGSKRVGRTPSERLLSGINTARLDSAGKGKRRLGARKGEGGGGGLPCSSNVGRVGDWMGGCWWRWMGGRWVGAAARYAPKRVNEAFHCTVGAHRGECRRTSFCMSQSAAPRRWAHGGHMEDRTKKGAWGAIHRGSVSAHGDGCGGGAHIPVCQKTPEFCT